MKNNQGYIALSSVLVILAVLTVIGITVSAASISDAQLSLAKKHGKKSLYLAESCVEEALLKLNEESSLPTTISFPEGDCQISLDAQEGSNWVFTVFFNEKGYSKTVQVGVAREDKVTINSWREI